MLVVRNITCVQSRQAQVDIGLPLHGDRIIHNIRGQDADPNRTINSGVRANRNQLWRQGCNLPLGLPEELTYTTFDTVPINCDSKNIAGDSTYSARTKHIALRICLILELTKSGRITTPTTQECMTYSPASRPSASPMIHSAQSSSGKMNSRASWRGATYPTGDGGYYTCTSQIS